MKLQDKDPFDYAKVERKIPASKELKVSFDLKAGQNNKGTLQIEFLDENGIACSRIELTDDGIFRLKGGSRFANMMKYEAGKVYHVKAVLSTVDRNIQVYVDGKRVGLRMFYAPVAAVERIVFRTGVPRTFPTVDTPADQTYDLPNAGAQDPLAEYGIANVKTSSTDKDASSAFLKYADLQSLCRLFQRYGRRKYCSGNSQCKGFGMDGGNIPLFECPQHNFEECILSLVVNP